MAIEEIGPELPPLKPVITSELPPEPEPEPDPVPVDENSGTMLDLYA
jgi:hypothetical protein